jgi:hypothetical protein
MQTFKVTINKTPEQLVEEQLGPEKQEECFFCNRHLYYQKYYELFIQAEQLLGHFNVVRYYALHLPYTVQVQGWVAFVRNLHQHYELARYQSLKDEYNTQPLPLMSARTIHDHVSFHREYMKVTQIGQFMYNHEILSRITPWCSSVNLEL